MASDTSEIIFYQTDDGQLKVNVLIQDETVWLNQAQMVELFNSSKATISEHIKNIYEEGELEKESTVRKFRTVQKEGKREVEREVNHYNLDVIISVGYRVKSIVGTRFRQWALKTLKEYMIKGFVLDDERLKQGQNLFSKDYFRELLDRVRSIRASERRIWQQITDIFAECSINYDKNSPVTKEFYAMVQNKFHYAITGQTAAEIIYSKANKEAENMGLTNWKNSPKGRILKSDTTVAKNYLSEKEIKQLERTITGYFDYIEDLIERENTFTMEEFAKSIDEFLAFRKYEILADKGKVSSQQAKAKAKLEYDKFNKTQSITSDFDKAVKEIQKDI
ncbi:MAG: virulence RhuM family protein [Micrococcaceae bacterium]